MKMKFEKHIRRVFPSLSRLTYNPVFGALVDSFDIPARLVFREFRDLPPNHMRIRVGVRNRIFFNQVNYLTGSKDFWLYVLANELCSLDSTIIDVGCGCGRYAHHLRDYRYLGERFSGQYIGVDLDVEMLQWCETHFDAERFRFHHSSDKSISYHAEGSSKGQSYRIPEPDGSVDFLFSTSLFTHLLEEEMINYTREAFRLLKPGRAMVASCFCLDYPPPTYGDRHNFRHQIGNAHVESLRQPEAAVAYTEDFLFQTAREAGFSEQKMITAPKDWQPLLLCRKQ